MDICILKIFSPNGQSQFQVLSKFKCKDAACLVICFLLVSFPATQGSNSSIINNFLRQTDIRSQTTTANPEVNQKNLTMFNVSFSSLKCIKQEECFIYFNSSFQIIKKGLQNAEKLFKVYAHAGADHINLDGLSKLMKALNIINDNNHEGHDTQEDHDDHKEDDDVDNHNDDHGDEKESSDRKIENKLQCIKSAEEIANEYYTNLTPADVKISFYDFIAMIPRLIYDLQSSQCRNLSDSYENGHVNTEDHNDDRDRDHNHNHNYKDVKEECCSINYYAKVWGIALGSVTIISLLSVVGILTVPLMKNSRFFSVLQIFLIALAVGTLVGDALLHLFPHALGEDGHNHGNGREKEKRKILINLVGVFGIYGFFAFESLLVLIRSKKSKQPISTLQESSSDKKLALDTPSPSDEFLLMTKLNNEDSLLNNTDNISNNKSDDELFKVTDNGFEPSNSSISKLHSTSYSSDSNADLQDHDHHHHNHGGLSTAKGIKNQAWAVITGDGLHNFSDGLAIGAAFSSSISAGLSTSLAIFCHELPHELGDFAILVDAGMSIKKALGCNVFCASLAFIGSIIGLVIGELTASVKLWILSVTAGTFLYVGLVDMLPQMLGQCSKQDGFLRFVFQHIGFLIGIMIMLVIAWFEDAFMSAFDLF